MSRSIRKEIRCPRCGHEQEFVMWQSVNVSLDPNLKEQILSGNLVQFCCEQCEHTTHVAHPLLYHDMDLHFMVYFFPADDEPEEETEESSPFEKSAMEGYQFRSVASYAELLEKIRLADAGIDDRMFECFKCLLREQWSDQISDADDIAFCDCEEKEGVKHIRIGTASPDGYHEGVFPYKLYDEYVSNTDFDPDEFFDSSRKWRRVNHRDFWGKECGPEDEDDQ